MSYVKPSTLRRMVMAEKAVKRHSLTTLIVLHASILFFSFSSVLSKLAATQALLSFRFFFFYGCSFFVLGVYAVIWQQILRRVPLNTAYGNRAVATVWSVIWGYLLFHETITWTMIAGAAVIIIGVYFVVTADG